ncbi:MAG: hypothetical protein UU46_C0035G0010 [Candidatus Uhrbacteria bacterium GW2011_GWD1_41_16]|nr:MAG: hypothetical protein UU46_C0035G0010 [Candidatus Uhrbacteria bacterium GW2011_GWD1_41_16]OGL96186.1 MAG: hypothetical protein A2317_03620 [Candidatus Uhrbacteria bacterium RIFOXYB2_FULL_41_10]HAL50558.1 hypothetical protein [Candidatus Uhrbacteria bacterium]HAN06761.1 hypothetical protein [Candidatus Uhrbacteria bacterium]HAP66121.1 hypothetical protein [Candidatus Uhrbacteria bacterium]
MTWVERELSHGGVMFQSSEREESTSEVLVAQIGSQDQYSVAEQDIDADEPGSTYRDESRMVSELFTLSRMS